MTSYLNRIINKRSVVMFHMLSVPKLRPKNLQRSSFNRLSKANYVDSVSSNTPVLGSAKRCRPRIRRTRLLADHAR
ncbi:hypothetical protein BN2476_630133 [Paraburkholderia piptadeniae]|uniref:Uncharacterized protein n=1 Tax=Paraburkholderia piptadeniae TaxID=1701573 RepID=A0A1N7SLR2_9BURK|nr:hypothetical protein BN2476_630133 [Paraburkholderia piptadeniae]